MFGTVQVWPRSIYAPTVSTGLISFITATTATAGGSVTSDGGATVTERGICWSTAANPTVSNSHTSNGTGTGSFSGSLTGLVNDTTYHVRAYATNSAGTAYGGDETFITTSVVNGGYGKLYNYYAAVDSRNIAAVGWHVPSIAELDTLVSTVGGSTIAGGKLKEAGTTHWRTPNTGADNAYGFNAVGAGVRQMTANEGFFGLQQWAEFWSNQSTIVLFLQYSSSEGYTGINIPNYRGLSIRLIKDDSTLANYTGNDGKTYAGVKIGAQVWMSENLRETRYRNQEIIPNQTSDSVWTALTTGAWCHYNNNSGYE